MNTYTKEKFSLGQISALAALILGSLILAFAWAPSTVHADSATDQYTEPQTPTKPPTDNSGGNGGNNSGGSGVSGNGSDGSTSTYVAPDTDTDSGSGGTGGSSGDQSDDGKKDGKSKEKKDKKSKSDDKNSKDSDSAATAFSGSDGGDGGGSSLPLIIALVIGIPALAVGGWYLYRRYGPQDDEARERLRHLVKSGDGASRPSEKP